MWLSFDLGVPRLIKGALLATIEGSTLSMNNLSSMSGDSSTTKNVGCCPRIACPWLLGANGALRITVPPLSVMLGLL